MQILSLSLGISYLFPWHSVTHITFSLKASDVFMMKNIFPLFQIFYKAGFDVRLFLEGTKSMESSNFGFGKCSAHIKSSVELFRSKFRTKVNQIWLDTV